jgi:hypothetical protein
MERRCSGLFISEDTKSANSLQLFMKISMGLIRAMGQILLVLMINALILVDN